MICVAVKVTVIKQSQHLMFVFSEVIQNVEYKMLYNFEKLFYYIISKCFYIHTFLIRNF